MAQVSDSTASPQEALGSPQSRNPIQNRQISPDSGKTAENGRTNRLAQLKESNDAQQVRQAEDRVLISREAQDQNRKSRVDEGTGNRDNPRPATEQRVNDLNSVDASGGRNNKQGIDRTQSQNITENNRQEVNAQRNRIESRKTSETRDQIKKEAVDRKNPEVQLREFQNRDKIRIEPKKVAKSVEEVEFKREREKAARETLFETPSQRIIQKTPPSTTEQSLSAGNNVRNDRAGNNQQPPRPVSVQTETGQNVDNLI